MNASIDEESEEEPIKKREKEAKNREWQGESSGWNNWNGWQDWSKWKEPGEKEETENHKREREEEDTEKKETPVSGPMVKRSKSSHL